MLSYKGLIYFTGAPSWWLLVFAVLSNIFDYSFYICCILLGTGFLQGTTIGLELVNEIRQQIQILVEYAGVTCKSTDMEFARVHAELREIGNRLRHNDKRISTLENVSNNQIQYYVANSNVKGSFEILLCCRFLCAFYLLLVCSYYALYSFSKV